MKLREYQADAARWLTRRPYGALFADPGTGKSLITLTTLRRLQLLHGPLRVLLIAPIRVLDNVWPAEIKKWGFDFSIGILRGKKRSEILRQPYTFHGVNPESLKWLMSQELPNYDVLILDESSLFRNPTAVRMKLMQEIVARIPRRYILTGTPTPNSLHDLWSQMYIVDQGKSLGTCVTHFRNAYFYHEIKENIHYFVLIPGMDKIIWDRVAELCHRIDAGTVLDLPPLVVNDIIVTLPSKAQRVYKSFERKLFAELDDGPRFAATAGSCYGMCRQIAGGALYKEDSKEYDVLHNAKIAALDELISELGGKTLLIVYQYQHEIERLVTHYGRALAVIRGGMRDSAVSGLLTRWSAGSLPLLAVQSQSISHGVNLQSGGNDIAWYTLTDDYDIYEQLNRRLYRSGVVGSVRIHRLLAQSTVDQAVSARLNKKRGDQQSLFDALTEYRAKTGG